jgi:hypothetical protein
MVNDVVQRRALLRVGCEDLLHKLARIERDIPVRRKLVLIIADAPGKGEFRSQSTSEHIKDSLIYFLDILGLERGTTNDKSV